MSLAEHLGLTIRQRREELGLSQSRLASAAGISTAQVSRLESGERTDPSFEVVVKLADVLDVSLDHLAGHLRAAPVISAEMWSKAGYDEVSEIVPGRMYEVWALSRHFRISVTLGILRGSTIRWNSLIEEEVEIELPGQRLLDVWSSPNNIPSSHRGDTPQQALLEAIRWLAEWGKFNALGRAQRDAEQAKEMDAKLRAVADKISSLMPDLLLEHWRDRTRARWSNDRLDIFISDASDSEYVMMTYFKDSPKHAKPVARLPLNARGAADGAARAREFFQELN
jgi:transcriptional regulator with XRE-family HTH domain